MMLKQFELIQIFLLCQVSDIKSAIEELKCKKIRLLTDKPFEGAHGKLVIFLHPKDCSGVLVELEEA